MGIRFYCPNGHRLNVKDYLAGKQGICPKCDVRFRIPLESEIPKGSPKIKPGSAAQVGAVSGQRRRNGGAGLKTPTIEKPAATVRVQSDERTHARDAIDEAPDAIWYVRPPSGGQYGPAKGDMVRQWIAEGRVSADSLVWREGWLDWKLAGPVFPSLSAHGLVTNYSTPSQEESISRQSPVTLPGKPVPVHALPVPHKAAAKIKSPLGVILLVVLILALFAGLVVVLAMKL